MFVNILAWAHIYVHLIRFFFHFYFSWGAFFLLFNVISVKCFFSSLVDRSSYVCLFIYFFSMKHLHVNAYFYDFYWSQCVKTDFFLFIFSSFLCLYLEKKVVWQEDFVMLKPKTKRNPQWVHLMGLRCVWTLNDTHKHP